MNLYQQSNGQDQQECKEPLIPTTVITINETNGPTTNPTNSSSSSSTLPGCNPQLQPTRDDAILSVAKVLHRHILHSKSEQEAKENASRQVAACSGSSYGSMRNTPRTTPRLGRRALSNIPAPRSSSASRYGSADTTPQSQTRTLNLEPSSPWTTTPPSANSCYSLNSPAIGSPYSSLSTPPQMPIDYDAAPHQFDADIFDIDHYLSRSYSAQVPLMSRILPCSVYEQKRQYHVVPIPTVEHVHKFIKRIFDQARLNAECVIIALIYIERLMETRSLVITHRNWIPVTTTALLAASKVWDDHASFNAEFAVILPIFTLKQINAMERTFLGTLSYELYISSTIYAQYYFGLKSLRGMTETRNIPRYYHAVGNSFSGSNGEQPLNYPSTTPSSVPPSKSTSAVASANFE